MAATFDDAALSSLTAKIDKKLSGGKLGSKKEQYASPKQNLKRKRQDEKHERAVKKRDSQPTQNEKSPKSKNAKPSIPAASALLDEIKALGGDEKDLELVENIDSDDEDLGDKGDKQNLDKGFQAELAKFAAGLGFEKVTPEEGEDEQEDEGEAEEDEGEQEEDTREDEESDDEETRDEIASAALKSKRKTIFEPRADWHAAELRKLPEPSSAEIGPYMSAIASLKAYGKSVLDEDSAAYSTTVSTSSSHKFMSSIMSSGTISDKTSALTLAIQESPVHNIRAMESLMGLADKRSRGQALAAAAALVDLLGPGTLLPPNRRLHPFSSQTGLIGTLQKFNVKSWSSGQALPGKITKEHLISWVFEDWLKEAYFKVLQTLETWGNDEVEYSRQKSVDMIYALLKEKPEQESNLLRLLVNKLGDRERKVASRASYLVLQLLNIHPGMKAVVIRSVEQEIIFKPGQSIRAKYYAVTTLNQTILSSKEPQIADSLLNIYFGMFVGLLKSGELGQIDSLSADPKPEKKSKKQKRRGSTGPPQKKEKAEKNEQGDLQAAEKLVSAILTGINRAVPFSDADQTTLESHLDTLFRITHSSNFNTSIQALMLIQQLSATRHLATERFYRTLYESLLDPRLATSSKQALYLNLLYRSLKSDVDVRRVKAFVKRMLQILNLQQPAFICGILYLTLELYATFPDLRTLLNEPEEHDEDEGGAIISEQDAIDDEATESTRPKDAYDGRKRDPEYSNAHRSCLWEFLPFLKHFHPSVTHYATSLLNGQKLAQKPDLASHTLINFLDKFVYKNAKATDGTKGSSLMQPVVAAAGQSDVLVSSKTTGKAGVSLNSAAFWNKKAEDVAAEDAFFHAYFSQIGKPAQAERTKRARKTEAESGGEEEEDEDEIWEALKNSRPEVQGEDESESELGSDFEELMSLDGSGEDLDGEDGDDMDVDEESDGGGVEYFSDEPSEDGGEDDESEGGAPTGKESTDGGKPESEAKKRRKMLKNLPAFASAEDYAEMLAQEEDGVYE